MTFKFKYNKIERERRDQGLYQQLRNGYVPPDKPFTLELLKQTISQLHQPADRGVKIVTNQAGLDMFNEAMAEQLKQKENEYRKRFSFKSEIFKQTYKFRQ
jgi:hypothetical protein